MIKKTLSDFIKAAVIFSGLFVLLSGSGIAVAQVGSSSVVISTVQNYLNSSSVSSSSNVSTIVNSSSSGQSGANVDISISSNSTNSSTSTTKIIVDGVAVVSNGNMIPNPSFETAASASTPAGWAQGNWGTNTAVFSYPVPGYDGQSAAKIQITSYVDGDAKWYFAPISITPGSYQFSDYYKSDTATYIAAQFTSSSGGLSYSDLLTLPPAANWTNAKTVLVVPAGTAKISIFQLIKSVGTLTVDNFSLTSYSIVNPPVPTSSNLILNPSFEYAGIDGQPLGWNKAAWGSNIPVFTYPITGFTGKAIKLQVSSYIDGAADWYSDQVNVKENYRYNFSDYYLSDASTIIEARVLMSDNSYKYIRLGNPGPSASWTKFSTVFVAPVGAKSLVVYHLLQANGALSVDEFKLAEIGSAALSQGVVSLNFDDGWSSAFQNAYPILNSMGLKTTQNIIIEGFNEPEEYVTLAQVKKMQAAGHEIGSHSKTHPDLTTLTSSQLTDEIAGSKTYFAANGINTKTFAYPFGAYNSTVIEAVKKAGYSGGRSSDIGFNTKAADKYIINTQSVENNTTIAQVKGWIDSAKQNKTWLVLLFHKVIPTTSGEQYSTTPAMISQIASYLLSQKVPVVTNSQGLQLIGQ